MMRMALIVIAAAVAVALAWLAWDGWFYIQRGYSLALSFAGSPTSDYHVEFPAWRAGVHVLLWAGAMASIGAYVAEHRRASTAAWLTFAATLFVGMFDVVQYGTLGSHTSIRTVMLLFLFVLLATVAPLSRRAEV